MCVWGGGGGKLKKKKEKKKEKEEKKKKKKKKRRKIIKKKKNQGTRKWVSITFFSILTMSTSLMNLRRPIKSDVLLNLSNKCVSGDSHVSKKLRYVSRIYL